MLIRLAGLIEERFDIPTDRTIGIVRRTLVMLAAILFAVTSTLIVGFEDIFTNFNSVANLRIGSVPSEDVVARESRNFVSNILTQQEREKARQQIAPLYDPPDPNVARQQTVLTQQILDFIDNVRRDAYADFTQMAEDINAIRALKLDPTIIDATLRLSDDSWNIVKDEITLVLERVMRQSIRESELENLRGQLPTQVSVRLSEQESNIVSAITEDVMRANTFANPTDTETARNQAEAAVPDQERQFVVGQTIAPANEPIDDLSYEALQELGLLTQESNQSLLVLRALLASTLVMVLAGLYITRFEEYLTYVEPGTLGLVALIFLMTLLATRLFGVSGNIYLFPTATLAILLVAVSTPNVGIIGGIGLALLTGLMARGSLEVATLVAAGSISAVLTLRNAGRLNNYFIAGLFIGITNAAVVAIFSLLSGGSSGSFTNLLAAVFNGIILVPTTSFAAMYALTVVFNLPTAFKLIDLSQPNKPLLQRLLREAPGTYQHSLQVANLAEQAAEAIGANAQLTHVGALYHDIGKMANPVFFTENQQHIDNPHESLNDPYRSADIIISHVTEGDSMAKKYGLPNRLRDFIREHHGTTQVYVFYKRAVDRAGGESGVDIADFTYPGPVPQSRESAIMMMADSCESAIRAIKPQSNQEITEVVHRIIEGKRTSGQLDASNLTLNNLRKIEEIFIDIFKGLFHPRIDYDKAVQPKSATGTIKRDTTPQRSTSLPPEIATKTLVKKELKPLNKPETESSKPDKVSQSDNEPMTDVPSLPKTITQSSRSVTNSKRETNTVPIVGDEQPLSEVPPLPKRSQNGNGTKADDSSVSNKKSQDDELNS